MLLGKVVGTLVATQKDEKLEGADDQDDGREVPAGAQKGPAKGRRECGRKGFSHGSGKSYGLPGARGPMGSVRCDAGGHPLGRGGLW